MRTVKSFADAFDKRHGLKPIATGLFTGDTTLSDTVTQAQYDWLDNPSGHYSSKPQVSQVPAISPTLTNPIPATVFKSAQPQRAQILVIATGRKFR